TNLYVFSNIFYTTLPGGKMDKKLFNKIIIVSIIFYAFGIIIGLFLIWYDWNLIVGFALGGVVSVLSFLLNHSLLRTLFKKQRDKKNAFWLTQIRFYLIITIHLIFIVCVVLLNKWINLNKISLFEGGINVVSGPINIFTYIGGISIVVASSIVAQFIKRKGE
ncbi:MAG: hypothetical protein K4H23_04900, partial [Mollicutes bacterium PWAP]|nr:hypothetical protein [Mollicutes bacterium PWAP]